MRTVRISDVTGSLSTYARAGLDEPVYVTRRGRPVMAVVPLTKNDDWESVRLSTHPKFLALVERSRESLAAGAGVSGDEMRRRLGLRPRKRR